MNEAASWYCATGALAFLTFLVGYAIGRADGKHAMEGAHAEEKNRRILAQCEADERALEDQMKIADLLETNKKLADEVILCGGRVKSREVKVPV